MSVRLPPLAAAALLLAALPPPALAHWCDDLWASSYNIVVKPATDTVDVPPGGTATLDLFVQNNMGYPLYQFTLEAQAAGYTIVPTAAAPTVAGYLMPGEKQRITLTISRPGGGTLLVESLSFYVGFGNSGAGQDGLYGGGGTAVMVRTAQGLLPTPPVGQVSGNYQGLHLQSSANAEYRDLDAGLDALLGEYCAGRGSWDSGDGTPIVTYCPSATATVCPSTTVSRGANKYDYQHLWAAGELAYRKASLGSRLPVLRSRLQCGWRDGHAAFRSYAAFLLGYLGEDAGARTFLQGIVDGAASPADQKTLARAGLVLMGQASDLTTHRAALQAALSSGGREAGMVAAAALGIADGDDAAVVSSLLAGARWIEPDTADEGRAMLAAHILNIVAWNQRGWARGAEDAGEVSFYAGRGSGGGGGGGGGSGGGGGGATPPPAGGSVTSSCGHGGAGLPALAALLALLPLRRRR